MARCLCAHTQAVRLQLKVACWVQSRRSLNPHAVTGMSSRKSLDRVRASLELPNSSTTELSSAAPEASPLKPAGNGQLFTGHTTNPVQPGRKKLFGGFGRRKLSDSGNQQTGPGSSRWGASYPLQLTVLFERSLKTRRFETLSTQDLVQYIIVGVLAGGPQSCSLWSSSTMNICGTDQ